MSAEDTVRAVVRGDQPFSALKAAGLGLRSQPGWTVTPALDDLAAGLIHYAKRRGVQRWAELLLHGSFIDFNPLPDSPEWDTLLGAVWDAAAGAPVPEAAIVVANSIRRTGKL